MADSGKQVIPRTVNRHFNSALNVLITYHPPAELAGLPTLLLGKRPAGIRTDRAWEAYLDALFTVQTIGTREGWVRLHQNRRGRGVFMVLNIPADGSSRRRQQTQEATNG